MIITRGIVAVGLLLPVPVVAQAQAEVQATSTEGQLRADLDAARRRIDALEARLDAMQPRTGVDAGSGSSVRTNSMAGGPGSPVGQAPNDIDRMPEIAALGEQGAAITRRGALTIEPQLDYTRADRNRALFRGIELIPSILVGVFDISENRQDVLGASLSVRYGLLDRLELGVRVPFIYRSDASVLTPIAGSTSNDAAATIDSSTKSSGIGDVEATMRYQFTRPSNGNVFLVGNLQLVAPTGTNPFRVPRDEAGRALESATGAGFWGVTPSLTAILPTDPAVLFGTIGYTYNFGRDVDAAIPPVRILRVEPGGSVSVSAGIGVALNQRTSLNLGYAHSSAFGTRTTTVLLDPAADQTPFISRSRDLQIGRLLFGVTYRLSDNASFNWGVEVGATEDAPDVRTTLRIPITVLSGAR